LSRFEQEAKAAAALNHPNILSVYQMGTYLGVPYLVSELLEGKTLAETLRTGPLGQRKAIDYGVQIARGLAAAHEKGVVHRDLKPANLFLCKDGRVKDSGLRRGHHARTRKRQTGVVTMTLPGTTSGTPGYMSPEQVRGLTTDQRSDIFSLGVVLYEMVTGKRGFKRPTSADTMSAILHEEPEPISQVVAGVSRRAGESDYHCLEKASRAAISVSLGPGISHWRHCLTLPSPRLGRRASHGGKGKGSRDTVRRRCGAGFAGSGRACLLPDAACASTHGFELRSTHP
jgi:serine/threonine protein kinase